MFTYFLLFIFLMVLFVLLTPTVVVIDPNRRYDSHPDSYSWTDNRTPSQIEDDRKRQLEKVNRKANRKMLIRRWGPRIVAIYIIGLLSYCTKNIFFGITPATHTEIMGLATTGILTLTLYIVQQLLKRVRRGNQPSESN